jgi:plasmid stability protein
VDICTVLFLRRRNARHHRSVEHVPRRLRVLLLPALV